MTFDVVSFILGILTGLGLLGVGIYFDVDDWFRR